MTAFALDQLLRVLPDGGDVRFTLADFPFDELLLLLHETRFSGVVSLGPDDGPDRLVFQRGAVRKVQPPEPVHMRLVVEAIRAQNLVSDAELREQIEKDARLDAVDLEDCFVFRGLVPEGAFEDVRLAAARKRLLELYDCGPMPVILKQGPLTDHDGPFVRLNPLPAAAYGFVACASDARVKAMQAFAAFRRVDLEYGYDVERNRYGLPAAVLNAVERLARDGAEFDAVPKLPGLSLQNTAGLLLLFRRMGVARFSDVELSNLRAVCRTEPMPVPGSRTGL